jgi:cell division protein ZapA
MNTSNICNITIMGKSYKIKCGPDEVENLQRAAKKLSGVISQKKSVFKTLDPIQLLILAGLHLSNELINQEKKRSNQREQLNEVIQSLESKIKEVAEE